MMELAQLVVRFERDWKPRRYPYLGQTSFMGVADNLTQGHDCKRVVEFSPHYGSPAAQIRMGQILDGDGPAADRMEEFSRWSPPPFWVLPAEGWRTARCLQASLESGEAVSAGVLDIIGPLSAEVDDWVEVMEAAVDADIRFHVDLETCSNPPEDLVLFVERDLAETAALVREAMEEAGIKITDDSEGGADELT